MILYFEKEKFFTPSKSFLPPPPFKMSKGHILWRKVLHQPESESEFFKIQTFVMFPTI